MRRRFFTLLCLGISSLAAADVLYLTDVEGSRQKLEEGLRASGDFTLGEDGFWVANPGTQLVYGGDAPDRFYGSMWVTEQLARLGEAGAILIVGNRDGNKPRLTGELSAKALQLPPPWFVWNFAMQHPAATPAPSRADRLRWIFKHSMGAPDAFELRRREIELIESLPWVSAQRRKYPVGKLDDELVVDTVLHELGPQGSMTRFLRNAKVMWRIDDTLYLHGGVNQWNFLRVPGEERKYERTGDWQAALNHWYRSLVQRWDADRDSVDGDGRRAAVELVTAMMPIPGTRSSRRSVITGRNASADNMPYLPPAWAIEAMLADGVKRLVLGHTPSGDLPTFLRTPDGRFEVICADNSYGDLRYPTILRIGRDGVRVESSHRDAGRRTNIFFDTSKGPMTSLGLYTATGGLVVAENNGASTIYRMRNYQVGYESRPTVSLTDLSPGFPPAVSGATRTFYFDADPPTLADRSLVAATLESQGLETIVLRIRDDDRTMYAAKGHRVEMARRLFADMPVDVRVVSDGEAETPFWAEDLANRGTPLPFAAHVSAENVRAELRAGKKPLTLHPDVQTWISLHGLYRPMAPRPCAQLFAE